jgi:predicted DNA-binding transcriptional regulator YafY
MYHPTTRLLTILELLQVHGELSGVDLAARLEVDVRTVRRYITMLQDMAIPIEAERGRHGGYRLRPGYKLPPLMVSTDEAMAITLGLLMTRRLGLGVDPVSVEGALAKLARVLPTALHQSVHALTEVLVIETPLPDKGPHRQVVNTLTLAVQRQEQIWLHYRTLNGDETERTVDPYGVLYRNGYWYMAGYCHLRHGLRAFRLDRVVAVQLNSVTFVRPTDFDILAFVEESIANTPGTWQVDLLLHTTLAEAERMIPRLIGKPQPVAGGVALRAYIQDLDWFVYFLAQLECPVQVLHPPEAQAALQRLADKLVAMATESTPTLPSC